MSADLIERLERAEVGSRELEGLIYAMEKALTRMENTTFILDINGAEHFQFRHPTKEHPSGPAALYVPGYNVPEYTESVDAALALAERVSPGARVMTEQFHDGKGWAMVQRAPESAKTMTDGNTPALALCIAILKAIQSKELS